MADFLTIQKLKEINDNQEVINSELERQRDRYASDMLDGLGDTIRLSINVPVTLTKDEIKYLKRESRKTFWRKIKNLFFGEKEEFV